MIDIKKLAEGIGPENSNYHHEWWHKIDHWWPNEINKNILNVTCGFISDENHRDSEHCWDCKIILLMVAFEIQRRNMGNKNDRI